MKIPLTTVMLAVIFVWHMQSIAYGQNRRKNTDKFQKELEKFAADPSLGNASWGFLATDARTGKELFAYNPDLALIPASTQKIVTTSTSLALLGGKYQFETLLQYDGQINDNTLNGNLIILGSGDPSLGSTTMHDSLSMERLFSSWYTDMRKAGILNIEGNIIADGSCFDDHMVPPKWFWEDIGNYYGAGAHGLTINENMYTVFFSPGNREGAAAEVIRTEPPVPGMDYINNVATGPLRSGDQVYIYGSPYGNVRWLTGTVPLGENNFAVRGSMPDPGLFLASAFQKFLENQGMQINGKAYTHRDSQQVSTKTSRLTISRWHSPELADITSRTNLNSVNTYAENLIKTMGKELSGKGTYPGGAEVISSFWNNKGLDTKGLRIHDGSGLSPFNNITVRQLTHMLTFIASDDVLFQSVISGFPVAGRSGSLSGLFRGTASEGTLQAKSGFLSNVRAYSGYTYCRNGNLIAFTIIVNNYSGSALQMRTRMVNLMDALTNISL